MERLLTVGHGTATPERLRSLLLNAGVDLVVDVRRFPGSRRNPDLAGEAMASWMPSATIGYHWEPRLGGRRRLPPGDDGALDGWWRVPAFRAYAAHMRTADFHSALAEVLDRSAGVGAAIMCSESLWWRCHRRLVSDAVVLLHERPVWHLGHDGRLAEHVPSAGARVAGRDLFYDAG